MLGVRRDKVKALIFQAREGLYRGRSARESACSEVRERLANARGKAPARGMRARPYRTLCALPRVRARSAQAAGGAGAGPPCRARRKTQSAGALIRAWARQRRRGRRELHRGRRRWLAFGRDHRRLRVGRGRRTGQPRRGRRSERYRFCEHRRRRRRGRRRRRCRRQRCGFSRRWHCGADDGRLGARHRRGRGRGRAHVLGLGRVGGEARDGGRSRRRRRRRDAQRACAVAPAPGLVSCRSAGATGAAALAASAAGVGHRRSAGRRDPAGVAARRGRGGARWCTADERGERARSVLKRGAILLGKPRCGKRVEHSRRRRPRLPDGNDLRSGGLRPRRRLGHHDGALPPATPRRPQPPRPLQPPRPPTPARARPPPRQLRPPTPARARPPPRQPPHRPLPPRGLQPAPPRAREPRARRPAPPGTDPATRRARANPPGAIPAVASPTRTETARRSPRRGARTIPRLAARRRLPTPNCRVVCWDISAPAAAPTSEAAQMGTAKPALGLRARLACGPRTPPRQTAPLARGVLLPRASHRTRAVTPFLTPMPPTTSAQTGRRHLRTLASPGRALSSLGERHSNPCT